MYLMLSKTISSTGKTSDVRYIVLSYEGSHEGADGIAHHVPARSLLNLKPSDPVVLAQMRPPWAAHGHAAAFSDATRALQSRYKSTPWSQPRRANRIPTLEYPSFSATDPLGRPKAAAQTRRRRPGRSFRVRDTTFVQVSAHEEAHGDRRHTG